MSPADAHSRAPRKRLLLASVLLGCTLLLVVPSAASAASMTWSPDPVTVNETIRLTAHPADQPHYEWDLNEDGIYETTGRVVKRVFHNVRMYEISMRILDVDLNVVDEARQEIVVHSPNNAPPAASFVHFPAAPVAGMPISLVSTSADPDSPIPAGAERWDLNGDGVFDDATGPSATVTYPLPGTYQVSLQVTTNARDVETVPLIVGGSSGGAPTVKAFRLMSPFPIVRIAGRTSRRGARIRRLSIDAPPGTSVKIRCNGRGCPFKSLNRTVSMRASAGAALPTSRLTLIRRLEGRTLRTRAILRVFVMRSDVIGKYTRFRIRKGRPPARQDSCLIPGTPKPVDCPSG